MDRHDPDPTDLSLSVEAVIDSLESGMTIGIGGWGVRRKPMALVRAICRSSITDLTVVSYGGPDVGLLLAAGKVKKLIYGFVSLDIFPLDPHFRSARESGAVEAVELDEGMLYWGLYAASLRLPFLPTRAGLATDVASINPQIKTVTSPYEDGETLLAMPALNLDVALVHVDRADRFGTCQLFGPDPFFDDLYCGAAERAFVTCEELVDRIELTPAEAHTVLLDRTVVSGVAPARFGAHPTTCPPHYGADKEHLNAYLKTASSEESWAEYRSRFLEHQEVEKYVEAVGGSARLEALPITTF